MAQTTEYKRFAVGQRLEHWILFLSFTTLAVTGLPQKFTGNSLAEAFIALMGGIETVRTIHHFSAIVLLLEVVYHFMDMGYKVFVRRIQWTMFPQLQDVFDAFNAFLYNLGLRNKPPQFDRFTFAEKFEYWALIWGTMIMALTGFMLWNPIITSRILPGEYIPTAKAAHGAEAILAVLAILVWHLYNVHVKFFNRAMFNGKMARQHMEEEHALELARLERGVTDREPADPVIAQRRRVYVPVAVVVSALLLFGVYLFATAEHTAITTLPKRAPVQVFVPQTPTPTPARTATRTPAPPTNTLVPGAPSPTAGAQPTVVAQPTTAPGGGGAASGIKPQPASHVGRTTCLACHGTGVAGPKIPADHAGRLDTTCADCHKAP